MALRSTARWWKRLRERQALWSSRKSFRTASASNRGRPIRGATTRLLRRLQTSRTRLAAPDQANIQQHGSAIMIPSKSRPSSDALLGDLMLLHPKLIDLWLGRVERLLAKVGHPEQKLPPVVHIG